MKESHQSGNRKQAVAVVFCVLLGGALVPGGQDAWAGTDLQWTWMKGTAVIDQQGTYGTRGTAAAANTPGARQDPAKWIDSSGKLWLFGGMGLDSGIQTGFLNDLWKYDPSSGHWTWMKGADSVGQSGVYGTILTPAAGNTPGERVAAVTWTDVSGNLWLFGGMGGDSLGDEGDLNDLWKYNPVSGIWTWMKGSNTCGQPGVYGQKGTEAEANTPGGRYGSVTWTDPSGKMWLFGGYGWDGASQQGCLNDLWRFDPSTNNWTWMKGANEADLLGAYGMRGTEAATNAPGGRTAATSWVDTSGALWLFGGYGYANGDPEDILNDLWRFNPATNNWTWMKGANTRAQAGNYGTILVPSATNTPGARYASTSWTDAAGALWLFGGYGRDIGGQTGYEDDLWKYDIASGNWTWVKGASSDDQSGNYGTILTPGPANTPGARSNAVGWANASTGALWLFGGEGYDGAAHLGRLNDLWRITLSDTVPPAGTVVINGNKSVTNSTSVTLSLTWADKGGSGAARMKFSNDAVTWTTWEPLAATKAWTLPPGDGYKTVRAMFRDVAGNNSLVYSDYIRLDTVPPTGSIIINGGASTTKSTTVSLGLAWSDGSGSGVTRMRFSIDGSHWSAWEPQKTPKSYTLPATLGYYTVRAQYLDAGNNASLMYNDYIKLVAP